MFSFFMFKKLLSIGKKSQFKSAVVESNVKEQPNVRNLSIKGKMRDEDVVFNKLSSLSYLEVKQNGKEISARHVESVDLKDNPYKFWTFTFKPHELELTYTYIASSRLKRINEVLTALCDVLTLAEEGFEVSSDELLNNFRMTFDANAEELGKGSDAQVREKENLRGKMEELELKVTKLQETNVNLTSEVHKLNSENDVLKIRLQKLEVLDTPTLKVRVQNWLETHDYHINVSKFAKTYDITEPRVEDVLDELAKDGFIKGRQVSEGSFDFQNVKTFENTKSFEKGKKDNSFSDALTKFVVGKKK